MRMAAGATVPPTLSVEDVFSAYTYTGTGATQSIVNGVDLATKGGVVWIKCRDVARNHNLVDTVRGYANILRSQTTAASVTPANAVTSFTSSGFSLGADDDGGGSAGVNVNTNSQVSWSFAQANKFFKVATATVTASADATVDLSSLETVGMVAVKRTDAAGSWYVWHRSLTAGKLLYLEQTAAEATLGHITLSGTTLTLEGGVIADGTYIVYAWAHDTASTGIIQCGSYTGNGSATGPVVTLGWEPQYVLIKRYSAAGTDWYVVDISRQMATKTDDGSYLLRPNTSGVEATTNIGGTYVICTPTGFKITSIDGEVNTNTYTYIYMAIRRGPMKTPTSGTQVYNAIARTGTGAAATVTGVGFPPDLAWPTDRGGNYGSVVFDRLRGATNYIRPTGNGLETVNATTLTSFDMDGVSYGNNNLTNYSATTFVDYFFRRYPGVCDEVCDTGTGSAHTVTHNLGAVPEMMIRKKRSAADDWYVYHANNTAAPETDYLVLNTTAATADLDTIWNDTAPTSTVFSVGTHDDVNQSTGTFVTYLFATLAGISKVFSYTGDGGTVDNAGTGQTINCGFAAGARFVMLKCTSHTSDWVVVDTVRGLIAGNDPALSLNTTAAEVTATDLLDPDNSGFIVNQLATGTTSANFNVTGRTYIGLAFA